jgi:WD40 repeat protein
VRTGERKATFGEYPSDVTCMSFSPDGKTLASAGELEHRATHAAIKLWDVETGREKATLEGHEGEVSWVAFSPAGHTFASAGHEGEDSEDDEDQSVKLWDVSEWTGK